MSLSYSDDVYCYCEFIESAIHQILFMRNVYSRDLFERTKLYGIAVQRARHPQLRSYIHESVQSLLPGINCGEITQILVVIQHQGKAVERWVFETLTTEEEGVNRSGALFEGFKKLHLRLQNADSKLNSLPDSNCTFEVVAHLKMGGKFQDSLWLQDGDNGLTDQHKLHGVNLDRENHGGKIIAVSDFQFVRTQYQIFAESVL